MSDQHVLGVDVGGTKVAAALVAPDGALRAKVELPTQVASAEAVLDGIERAVAEVIDAEGEPEAIGVGMPSQIDFRSGTVLSSVNVPVADLPLRAELTRRFGGTAVYVDNDANCAALGEAQLVPDPPARELVMLTLGTGVGGGVVIGGRIFRGATGLGAELGHVVIDPAAADDADVPEGRFPRPGSLEWFCSGTGLEREATRRAAAAPDSELGRIGAQKRRVKGREAVEAARTGDAEALELMREHGRRLGMGIAGVVNTFEPERIVIGGGLSRAADLFLNHAVREAARWALPELWQRTTVELARGGADAGLIGAGVLATQELARSRDTARSG